MRIKKYSRFTLLFLVSVFLCSCFGVSADIVLNSDDSGTIVLEYRISRLLESLGAYDGNERRLPVPVGRDDFERSVMRLPGMSLVSFSSKHDGRDLINTVSLRFADREALVNFLDPSGEKALNFSDPNRMLLHLSGFAGRNNAPNSSLAELFGSVSEGYFVNISLTLPSEGTLTAPSVPGAVINPAGRKLSFSLPLSAVLNSEIPLSLDFRW